MEVKWAIDAKNDYHNALDYWYEHNGSFTYSAKIIQAVEALEYDLANNPSTAFSHGDTLTCGQFQNAFFVILLHIASIDQIGLMRAYEQRGGQKSFVYLDDLTD